MNLSILGPPGSGKGTQARRLKNEYNLYHIDVGQCLRDIAEEDSTLGKKVSMLINDRNALVSNEVVQQVLESELVKAGAQDVIIDGAPRRVDQADPLEESLKRFDKNLHAVIFLKVDEEMVTRRISKRFMCPKCEKFFILGVDVSSENPVCDRCGSSLVQRADDTPDGVKRRLKIFAEETLPVVEHYREEGRLIEVDSKGSIEEVFGQIREAWSSFGSE